MKNIFFLGLIALMTFGCQEEIGVIGCTDELAYNFNADAEVDNGNCQYIEGCTDPAALNYNEYAMIMDGSCVYEGEGGGETTENPNDPCEGEDVLTYHGYDYPLVAVGSQCWMKENLRAVINNADSALSFATIMTEGVDYEGGQVAFYENDASNIDLRGVLYRNESYVINTICPVGWHPSNYDDMLLLSTESNVELVALGHRLKATAPLWDGVDQFGLTFVRADGVVGFASDPTFYTDNTAAFGSTQGEKFEIYGTGVFGMSAGGATYWPIRCIKE